MISPSLHWFAPSPLWPLARQDEDTDRLEAPVLLRYTSDRFIDEVQAVLATDPARLKEQVAQPEKHSQEAAGWLPEQSTQGPVFDPGTVLKLYQPAHERFYLVAASLVCRLAGFPDRRVDPSGGERPSFVLRRLVLRADGQPCETDPQVEPAQPTTFEEQGWTGESSRWVALDDPMQVRTDEERLPLFSLPFEDKGRPRTLRAGFVPVAARDTFEPEVGIGDGTIYVLRCVFEPAEGSRQAPAVSAPTQAFRMADFYDPEAPVVYQRPPSKPLQLVIG